MAENEVEEKGGNYAPPSSLSESAFTKSFEEYQERYAASVEDPESFWTEIAETFHWFKKWDTVRSYNYDLDEGPISIKWFEGGRTNITYNNLDRHLDTRGDQVAILWEGNAIGEDSSLTYRELHAEVCRCANVLKSRGVKKGDRVSIYMPMIPELAVAMLACARIGAIHSIVFGGFSSEALADRIVDSTCPVLITANGTHRGDKPVLLKESADEEIRHAEERMAGQEDETCLVVQSGPE